MNKNKKDAIYLHLLLLLFLPLKLCLCAEEFDAQNTTATIDVGVILDLDSWSGKVGLSCIKMALSDFYATHHSYTTRLKIHVRDSNNDVVEAASAAIDLLKNVQVRAILGPQRSGQADFVANIGNKTHVPVITFSATSPFLSSTETPYFVRIAQNDSNQVHPISAIVQAFGWKEVVPIYEDTDCGRGFVPFLTDSLQDINVRVPYRSVISPLATDDQILKELYKLMTMQTRVYVVHMPSSLASRVFLKAKEAGMMSKGYSWIITYELTDTLCSLDPSVIDSMQGVLGVKPHVPRSKKLNNFATRWRRKFRQENIHMDRIELDVFGLWAYDSIWALAKSAEQVSVVHSGFKNLEPPGKNLSDLKSFNIGVSQVGSELLRALQRTRFEGLSGEYHLIDGELPSSTFEIVNVIGKGERGIGFWSPTYGLSKELLKPGDQKNYSTSKDGLGAIIWPGEQLEVPKGWEMPTSGKKLRVGVPVKDGFLDFVKVERSSPTSSPTVTGFCIDVFEKVMMSLPYAVPYEYVPFELANGTGSLSYNDLVNQVYLQNFDAVVGDITILANRSLHVDFTLPYTESGVSMIVPIKDDERRNAWIFLKPLTMDLWLTTGAFFIFTGFVVWVLEHGINVDFRGPPHRQVGMIFWFSFSTLVFAHKEKVLSNLSRFVMIIWVFVVLVLTSSYTASLTSMLTVEQLQPTITDLKDIIKNGEYIGYQKGSFVAGLMESLKVDRSKLKSYSSVEEFHEALSRGSRNGGVSAIVDEIPFVKLFLAKYCKKYTVVGRTYKIAGYGFVFPKGSPLVPDVSTAILNITEGETMSKIEQKWFGQQEDCPEQGATTVTSNSLTIDSFRGLFLVAGLSSSSALFIFFFVFLHEHKDILKSEGSVKQIVTSMIKQFDQKKEISTDTSHKGKPPDCGHTIDVRDCDQVTPNMSTLQSPAMTIISSYGDGIFTEEEDFSCTEPSTPNHHSFFPNIEE
ncbi:PREDICTED: glutamate receptor 2.8-like [Nelumbo nucifera]|uniref:Glutamate receptor n=2 Tax=Nelumbo nucifera TaxID=4432 RepID=A0A822Y8U4_NELNU|nr:PREDICTED: glutamate receptor 2.8-like [Nelumbo nucifera]DAD27616.1 TPA_asm: hypothetical protein HUJ06_029084 [Nelumbo nucifera]